ncbi:hypothetical protein ABE527_21195 [Brucella sp. TWI432]
MMVADRFGDVCELFSNLALSRTHRLPEFIVDDPQFWNGLYDPIRLWVETRDPFAS